MGNFFIQIFFVLIGFSFFVEAGWSVTQDERTSTTPVMTGKLNFKIRDSFPLPAKVDTQATMSETSSFLLKTAFAEAAYFPQEKDWTLTLEQMANFDFIKEGGTGLSYYYLQVWFNMIRYVAQEPLLQKSWEELCYKKDCSTGLDPQKINEPDMRSIIRKLSILSSMDLFSSESAGWDTESVFFLQGFPAPVGSDPWLETDESGPSPKHIKELLKQLEKMKERGIKKIAVNLPPQLHKDPWPFVYLGEFINQQKIDLHIVGGCGHYCATYLVPAAETVYIGPYGYIYHKGNATGSLIETLKVFEPQRQDLRRRLKTQRLPELTYKERCEFVVMSITDFPYGFFNVIEKFLKTEPERKDELFHKYTEVEHEMSSLPVAYWPEETIRAFVQSLSPELLEDVTLLLLESRDDETTNRRKYIVRLRGLSQLEVDYYLTTKAIELMSPAGHNYIDFLIISSSLLRDPGYVEYFTVPKPHLNIPEKDKPYEWIVPSAELLRYFGLPVIGENNREMIDFADFASMPGINKEYPKENFLYLTSARMKNCGFFDEDVSLSNEKLEMCLSGK